MVAQDARADIGSALFDVHTGRLQAYELDYLKSEYIPVGDALAGDLKTLKDKLKAEFSVMARSDADDKWIVGADPVMAPASTWLYERKGERLTKLFTMRPEPDGAPLVGLQDARRPARRGRLGGEKRCHHARKAAIMGGSYGGYATLAGMTCTPTTFACGVDIVDGAGEAGRGVCAGVVGVRARF